MSGSTVEEGLSAQHHIRTCKASLDGCKLVLHDNVESYHYDQDQDDEDDEDTAINYDDYDSNDFY